MKPIKDYPNYLVTPSGDIFSTKRGIVLKGGLDKDGYKLVTLQDGKRRRTAKVHREVAKLYCPKPEGHDVVNHIDGVKTNNHPDNLEWTTVSGNTKHAYALGSLSQKGEANNSCKYSDATVTKAHAWHELGYSIKTVSTMLGIKYSTVYSWIKGSRRFQSSETIPKGSTSQAIGDGSGAASDDV